MPNQIIDTKTEAHTFKKFPFKETITTTGKLVMMEGAQKFGLSYEATYSGIKNGNLSGGPIPISGNGSGVEHNDPKVLVEISNFSDDGSKVSMHVLVTVDVNKAGFGTVTLFDQTLGGKYGNVSLKGITEHIAGLAGELPTK